MIKGKQSQKDDSSNNKTTRTTKAKSVSVKNTEAPSMTTKPTPATGKKKTTEVATKAKKTTKVPSTETKPAPALTTIATNSKKSIEAATALTTAKAGPVKGRETSAVKKKVGDTTESPSTKTKPSRSAAQKSTVVAVTTKNEETSKSTAAAVEKPTAAMLKTKKATKTTTTPAVKPAVMKQEESKTTPGAMVKQTTVMMKTIKIAEVSPTTKPKTTPPKTVGKQNAVKNKETKTSFQSSKSDLRYDAGTVITTNKRETKRQNSSQAIKTRQDLEEKLKQRPEKPVYKESQRIVEKFLKELLSKLKTSRDFNFVGHHTAGSAPTNTKIGEADEFDFDLEIQLEKFKLEPAGSNVSYELCNCTNDLKQKFIIQNNPNKKGRIPDGFVALYRVRFGEEPAPIIPRKIQECIFDNVRYIKENTTFEKEEKVKIILEDKAHGPAVNVILHSREVKHEINLDLTASIRLPIGEYKWSDYGWPRRATKEIDNFDESLITSVGNAPVQLVPKKEKFWKISSGAAEKVLLKRLDSNYGCRKKCHMLLKIELEEAKKIFAFDGISTYIFKHLIFWCNEELPSDIWIKSNLHVCYCRVLEELQRYLSNEKLPNYFMERENVLQNVEKHVLREYKKFIDGRLTQLRNEIGDMK